MDSEPQAKSDWIVNDRAVLYVCRGYRHTLCLLGVLAPGAADHSSIRFPFGPIYPGVFVRFNAETGAPEPVIDDEAPFDTVAVDVPHDCQEISDYLYPGPPLVSTGGLLADRIALLTEIIYRGISYARRHPQSTRTGAIQKSKDYEEPDFYAFLAHNRDRVFAYGIREQRNIGLMKLRVRRQFTLFAELAWSHMRLVELGARLRSAEGAVERAPSLCRLISRAVHPLLWTDDEVNDLLLLKGELFRLSPPMERSMPSQLHALDAVEQQLLAKMGSTPLYGHELARAIERPPGSGQVTERLRRLVELKLARNVPRRKNAKGGYVLACPSTNSSDSPKSSSYSE